MISSSGVTFQRTASMGNGQYIAVVADADGYEVGVIDTDRQRAESLAFDIAGINNAIGPMSDHQMNVCEFMLRAGQKIPRDPQIPDIETLRLRCNLIVEEVREFVEACGFTIADPDIVQTQQAPDYEAMIDACADIDFVNIGTLLTLGAGDLEVLETVDDANLRKFSGDWSIVDGKLKKPSNWTPPEYAVVERFNAPAEPDE